MKTDYSRIADRYDKNPIRHHQPREALITEVLAARKGAVKILDLACGTGNYLAAQIRHFPQKRIRWFGCDLSPEMLDRARGKRLAAELSIGNAEELAYASGSFDMVACNFAFHHFLDKARCIREIRRTLKSGGVFVMSNICPEMMPASWVYHYFPQTRAIDRERFWTNQRLFRNFQAEGFTLSMTTTIETRDFLLSGMIEEAKNRDMSQLTLIGGEEYREGLSRMKKEASRTYTGEFATLRLVARKAG